MINFETSEQLCEKISSELIFGEILKNIFDEKFNDYFLVNDNKNIFVEKNLFFNAIKKIISSETEKKIDEEFFLTGTDIVDVTKVEQLIKSFAQKKPNCFVKFEDTKFCTNVLVQKNKKIFKCKCVSFDAAYLVKNYSTLMSDVPTLKSTVIATSDAANSERLERQIKSRADVKLIVVR